MFAYSTLLATGESAEEVHAIIKLDSQKIIPKMNEKDSIMEYSLMLTDEEKTNSKDAEEKVQENKKPFEEAAEVLLENQ